MGAPPFVLVINSKIDQQKFILEACAVGFDLAPLEKVYSVRWRRKFRSIESYISLNYVGSNIFWWIG